VSIIEDFENRIMEQRKSASTAPIVNGQVEPAAEIAASAPVEELPSFLEDSADPVNPVTLEPAEREDGVLFSTEKDLIEGIRDFGTTFEGLRSFLKDYPSREPILDERLKELIRLHAPKKNGGHAKNAQQEERDCQPPSPPSELRGLVESGAAFYTEYTNGRPNHWMVKRCPVCHSFNRDECCGRPTVPVMAEQDGELTRAGKQAIGLESVDPVKTPEQKEEARIESWKDSLWWKEFRGADELTGSGTVEFVIEGFLMKGGVTFFGGPPEGGKSLVGMSVAKALTTGKPLFGKLNVIEPSPVLWLAAEGGDNGLKIRCKKFRITPDKNKFICRTLNQGMMLSLDDQNIERLVRQMHPVVVLETVVRFGEGNEDSAADTNKLAGLIFHLISYGAKAVIAIHHARKNIKDTGASLEGILRGSSDFAAMADVVIAVMRDERSYRTGAGPNEIELITCKGRDFAPVPIRLAITERAPEGTPLSAQWKPGFISCIDQTGDLKWVDQGARVRMTEQAAEVADQGFRDRLAGLIKDNPTVNAECLAEETGAKVWMVKATLKDMGYTKASGRAKAGKPHQWTKQRLAASV